MKLRPGGPVKKYGRFRLYDDHVELRGRLKRWQVERSEALPLRAKVEQAPTETRQKTTVTRVVAGTAIAGPVGGFVGAHAKKTKTRPTGFPTFTVWRTDGTIFYRRSAFRVIHAHRVAYLTQRNARGVAAESTTDT